MIDRDLVLAQNSDRFLSVLRDVPDGAPVPSCPDWSAADLLWHLTYVQAHWADIVERRVQLGDRSGTGPAPERPADRAAVIARFEVVSARLRAALAGADDDEPVWTWSADHSIAWVRRRQAQEALVHRVDAELAAGLPSMIDPIAAADGIDELLGNFGAPSPAWGSFVASGPVLAIRAADAEGAWRIRVGRFHGVDPGGQAIDRPDFAAAPAAEGPLAATISGPADALLLWLWGRADGAGLDVDGDACAVPLLRAAVAANAR